MMIQNAHIKGLGGIVGEENLDHITKNSNCGTSP
jgi:hypothetical protein